LAIKIAFSAITSLLADIFEASSALKILPSSELESFIMG
jgi:hypothetical protein